MKDIIMIIIMTIEAIVYILVYRYMLNTYGVKSFLITFAITIFSIVTCIIKDRL